MTSTDSAKDARRQRLGDRVRRLFAEDPQFRAAKPDTGVDAAVEVPGLRLAQVVATIMDGYAERPALGHRAQDLVTDDNGQSTLHPLPEFETVTYGELWGMARALASAWYHDPTHPVRAGDFVAMLGFTSVDYTAIDLACIHLGAVAVPLQTSAPASNWTAILAESEPSVLAVSAELLDAALESALATPSLRHIAVFDYHPGVDGQRESLESAQRRISEAHLPISVDVMSAVIGHGRALPDAPLFTAEDGADPLALVIYTSGSTGTPKGATYTETMVAKPWLRADTLSSKAEIPLINLNFMPMSHVMGRGSLVTALACGGLAYFAASSDMSTLFEDITLTRPTVVTLVPRVCDMLFQRYRNEVDRRTAVDSAADPAALDAEIKTDIRENLFGGRVLTIVCGSAPLSDELAAFIESCLDARITDGYGSTEAGVIVRNGRIQRPPVIDYKLADVPELGYFSTDKPHPRGELLVKAESVFTGYFKRPDVTAEVFDPDGYYKTGDIVAELEPDRIQIVDRRNNVIKLSQGEFVAIANLEAEYANSALVQQICVYGSSERSYLLAVVVPTSETLELSRGDDESLKRLIAESLQQVARDAELQPYEVPRDFLVETEPFTAANGLLTGIAKLARPKLHEKYGARLEQLYSDIASAQALELQALHSAGHEGKPVVDTVQRAATALLGLSAGDVSPDAHFIDLGGDSLSALAFSDLLRDIFAVEIPVGDIVSAANDLTTIARIVETRRGSDSALSLRPTAESVHGIGHTEIRAADLTLDKFIDPATLQAAPSVPRAVGIPQTVLLTGANGYLGRFLALEWLERLDKTGGTLIAVIRGKNAQAAYQRLEDAFDSGDSELLQHFRSLADKHLEVLPGDIGDPNLGLDADTWQRLADTVDVIIHPAALVNHVLPYSQLFGPNVVGTAEIIKLALTTKIKPVTYLSTVAVAISVDPKVFDEVADIRAISAVRPIDAGYANGYGNAKWAGEVLLREAHDLCGLPVAVFRSDMILAHSRYTGQLNVPDQFTRLILSVIATGIAPGSFYQAQATAERPVSHYDGLPADFTASAITALGVWVAASEGIHTYDSVNPHADGISLDNFVDWLIDAGYPIQRIDNYSEWFARFDTAIRGLPEKQKQHSLLPLLHAYRYPQHAHNGAFLPAIRFREGVRTTQSTDIPHLSRELIVKYAKDLEQLGLL
ncbi:carboxylic acid reductase [Mycobacterium sp. CBMA271]|uniref:carboxylic acid reductase n=1 Tax=unclassified Mycobacteroides TaxID=2618759 RepID=UPI0012DC1B77|nr:MULTISPECIES: carboxylic acid reductase [unclassified Mycobacteroides]MUM17156.1 oxidoreductase [Mycobacteroides sp. CBMA 326]MUM23825.1 carboxylic acid reductase [Mycobacteroides sp. CBMA 271]